MTDYKFLYKQQKWMLEKYQDELVPQFRKQIEKMEQDIAQLMKERDEAEMCIDGIEDALDRGNDNDWAREAIANYRKMREGKDG